MTWGKILKYYQKYKDYVRVDLLMYALMIFMIFWYPVYDDFKINQMKYYILFYETVEDYLEKRGQYREEHLALAQESHRKGELILGGALSDPADKAVLVFKSEDPGAAENFAKKDPYVKNGLVKEWYVRPWNVVIGNINDL